MQALNAIFFLYVAKNLYFCIVIFEALCFYFPCIVLTINNNFNFNV